MTSKIATSRTETQCVRLDASAGPLGAQQIGLVPGALVTVMTLDLPQGVRGEARENVARRQLRDMTRLGLDTVEMRPFPAPRDGDSWNRVLVAGTAEMAQWRAQAGQSCRAVLPDYLALPAVEGIWTIAQTPGGLSVRLGLADGFSGTTPVALALLNCALAETDTPPRGILMLEADLPDVVALAAGANIPVLKDPSEAGAKVFANGELDFDLRKDPQAARARLRARVLPWRWPAMAALLAAAVWGTTQVVATRQLNAQRSTLEAASMELVRTHFLPTGPILDIRVQVARALADRQAASAPQSGDASNSPMALMGRTAAVLHEAPQVTVGQITYSEPQGLTVQVFLDDFSRLDQLLTAFAADGLVVTVAQSRATATATEAELRISAVAL